MAALTDGTTAGTITAPSPLAPPTSNAPAPADFNPLTGGSTTAQIPASNPVSTISSKAASDLITGKITPALNDASTAIANNNATSGYVYGVPVIGANGKTTNYSGPQSGLGAYQASMGAAPASTPSTTAPNTSSTATSNPDAGYKYAYDPVTGAQSQIPVEDNAADYGLSPTNPKAPPTTPLSSNAPIQDTVGNTYKSYTDGTYGKFDAAGNYIGPATAQEVQDAQTSTGLMASLGQLANGTYPLTSDQQAQVNGLQQQYQQLIDDQTNVNANNEGGMAVLMNLRGLSGDAVGMSAIAQTAAAGVQKIAALDSQMVAAVAKMKSGFLTDDETLIKAAYDTYNASQTAKQAELDKLTAAAQSAAQDAIKNKQAVDTYNLNVAQFQQTGDQDAFDNALKTEQEAEAVRHDKETEAISAYSAGMGAGGGSVGGVTISAPLTATGTPDPTAQKAVLDQITQRYGPMTATAIQGLADYSINPADWSSRAGTKGLSRADAVALAQMYDPTYNDADFSVRQTYMTSLASTGSGTVGGAVNSANKAINHLTAFVTTMGKISAPGVVGSLNTQSAAAAQTEALGVADELAKFFKGTGSADVSSVEAWDKQVNAGDTPGQVKGLTQGAITLLAGQLDTLSEQYASTMGKPPANNFLSPTAMASLSSLKNQGYQVDIPGVLYTDKAAYIKNDPSAVDNMNAATQQLQAAGLPLTPDNILQLAQSQ